MSLSVVYYSDNRVPPKLQRYCLDTLRKAVPDELVCIFRPHRPATHRNLYEQILAGIAAAKGDMIALAEHDVLYPAGYFESLAAAAPAGIVYNTNIWRLNRYGYFRCANPHLLSNCGGRREWIVRRIRQKLSEGIPKWAEPPADAEFESPHPTVDIRHGQNFTGDRRAAGGRYRKTIPYWGRHEKYTQFL